MKLIALREVWFAGKTRHAGDEFECGDLEARILTAPDLSTPQAARYADEPVTKAAPVRTAAVIAEPAKAATVEREPEKAERKVYKRRDLRAED